MPLVRPDVTSMRGAQGMPGWRGRFKFESEGTVEGDRDVC